MRLMAGAGGWLKGTCYRASKFTGKKQKARRAKHTLSYEYTAQAVLSYYGPGYQHNTYINAVPVHKNLILVSESKK